MDPHADRQAGHWPWDDDAEAEECLEQARRLAESRRQHDALWSDEVVQQAMRSRLGQLDIRSDSRNDTAPALVIRPFVEVLTSLPLWLLVVCTVLLLAVWLCFVVWLTQKPRGGSLAGAGEL